MNCGSLFAAPPHPPMPKLHLIEGPVGAGKSTFAGALALRIGGVHIALDEWFARLFSPDRPATDVMPWYIEHKARLVDHIWNHAQALLAWSQQPAPADIAPLLESPRHLIDRRRPIDHDPQDPADRFAADLQIEQFETVTGSDTTCGVSQAINGFVSGRSHRSGLPRPGGPAWRAGRAIRERYP